MFYEKLVLILCLMLPFLSSCKSTSEPANNAQKPPEQIEQEQPLKNKVLKYQNGEVPINTSIMCKEDEKVGFDWENKKWVKTNFKENTYIIKKQPLPKENESDFYLLLNKEDNVFYYKGSDGKAIDTMTLNRIYKISDFGSEYPSTENCEEYYTDKTLDRISCGSSSFVFKPNGSFAKTSGLNVYTPTNEDDYKDSLTISHGKCSEI